MQLHNIYYKQSLIGCPNLQAMDGNFKLEFRVCMFQVEMLTCLYWLG